ncbi:hypothetical protein MSAN_00157800 [Mycena sanguinolenta]|uniref:Uncharacterized protein n=1 Tax=Mycena sanguinolenta TaxID=230812 RepID=A0A8H7DN69_9AGAR|nr:hypothetical protein MSAN_00157800 [Mycena sanguinolenta]
MFLRQLYGPDVIRPNHHYATHTVTGIRNYGPLHEFWTFLFERLNKVLKSYKTPNHAGGELESSFFREFHRTVQEARLLGQGAREVEGSELQRAIQVMYRASADDRGTVQALSRELDAAREDDGIKFELSSRSEITVLPSHVYFALLRNLNLRFPNLTLHSYLSPTTPLNSIPLVPKAVAFDYVIINHTRYLASSRAPSDEGSLLAVRSGRQFWVGELQNICVINQSGIGVFRFGYMRWFRPTKIDLEGTVWKQFASSNVHVWDIDQYLGEDECGPGPLIDLQEIFCHVVRLWVVIRGQTCWATVFV